MKTIFIIMFVGLGLSTAYTQAVKKTEIPSLVKTAFAKMYPGIAAAMWSKEINQYRARFSTGTYKGSVVFASTGKWTEREIAIPVSALPVKVKKYMQVYYKKEKLTGAAKIIKASGELIFEAEIKGQDLYFTKDGDFIK